MNRMEVSIYSTCLHLTWVSRRVTLTDIVHHVVDGFVQEYVLHVKNQSVLLVAYLYFYW